MGIERHFKDRLYLVERFSPRENYSIYELRSLGHQVVYKVCTHIGLTTL
jgi:hypothetical protein